MSCIEIPENIKLPYDPSPCVYEIKFPDLEKIYIGQTVYSIGHRIDDHLATAWAKKHGNKNLEKLIRRALSGKEKMVVKILDRGIFEEKELRYREAKRIMEVMEAGKYELLNIEMPTNIVDGKKYCPCCKKRKPPENFSRDRCNPSGLNSYCKACRNENLRKKRAKILAQMGVKQYTIFDQKPSLATVSVTGAIVLGDNQFRLFDDHSG